MRAESVALALGSRKKNGWDDDSPHPASAMGIPGGESDVVVSHISLALDMGTRHLKRKIRRFWSLRLQHDEQKHTPFMTMKRS
jgi:hypothetical protein